MKTMEEERAFLIKELTAECSENAKDIIAETIGFSFDHGAKCAHERARMLLIALEDFQKDIYETLKGDLK